MEHHRFTLAATAIVVFGAVVATNVHHSGNRERADRQTRVVAITRDAPPAPTIWMDPPRRMHASEPAALMADGDALLAPRPTMSLPSGARMAPRLAGTLTAPVVRYGPITADPIGDLIRGPALGHDS